jgi:hypothetical protein
MLYARPPRDGRKIVLKLLERRERWPGRSGDFTAGAAGCTREQQRHDYYVGAAHGYQDTCS